MTTRTFDTLLDECLDRVMAGDSVDRCASAFPEYERELRPLLEACLLSRSAATDIPSRAAMDSARTRMLRTRATTPPLSAASFRLIRRFVPQPIAFAATASIGIIALAMLLLLPLLDRAPAQPPAAPGGAPADETPGATPSIDEGSSPAEPDDAGVIAATPHADGNFAFLFSDQPNDMPDFESLVITVSSVRLKPRGEGAWVELTPKLSTVDLAQLQGELALEVWRGDVPEGDYEAVDVYVAGIQATLASAGESATVFLPSDRLHVDSPFTVGASDAATEFVFDITVHRTGGFDADSRYILSPQAGESGPGKHYVEVEPEGPAPGAPDDMEDEDTDRQNDDTGQPDGDRPGRDPDFDPPGNDRRAS